MSPTFSPSARVGVINGYWSTNIGNAFFMVGAKHLLAQSKPDWDVQTVPDVAGYAFPKKQAPDNALEWIDNLELTHLAILGPFIRPEFSQILLKPLQRLRDRGVKLLGLGVGMMDYSKEASEECIREMGKLPFVAITTRDKPTYEALKHLNCPVYDGIDLGFFLPEVTPAFPLKSKDYLVLNFDCTPEPVFTEVPGEKSGAIEINGRHFSMEFPKWRTERCFSSVAFQIFDRMFLPQAQTVGLAGLKIVRTDHRFNPVIKRKIYCRPNTFSHDIWEPYSSIYSGSRLTLTNRVHATVATTAFGRPAMLFSKTGRSALLDRVGAEDIRNRPITIPAERLSEERANMKGFLSSVL